MTRYFMIFLYLLTFNGVLSYVKVMQKVSKSQSSLKWNRFHKLQFANENTNIEKRQSSSFWKTVASVSLVSGPLGTLLDNQHGLFQTLYYTNYQIQISFQNHILLKTAIWVPFLFTIAGFIMSSMILFLDQLLDAKNLKEFPAISWPKVFYGISFFAWQYYLSGWLDSLLLLSPLQINVILSVFAVIGYWIFDRTVSGLIVAVATAIAGPVVEIAIINYLHIYSYTNADFLGICSWIPAVYFLGGQAVGNLTRKVYQTVSVE